MFSARFLFLLLTFPLLCVRWCASYSVLTHEEIIDICWRSNIVPLLQTKYPGLTDAQLNEAHAFAYGGSIIQDLGYYPFGNKYFSDLLHYVRTGDMVRALLRDAQNANEYAFALGALAHYVSDDVGHPAVNTAVALEFPKLRKRYGDRVTYAEGKIQHIQTEFGFDMAQVAKHRYTSDAYHSFIGFQVAQRVLEQAFFETYGLHVDQILTKEDTAINSYRHSVSKLIPELTRVALKAHKDEIVREIPDHTKQKFLYNVRRADYEREWGSDYYKPSFKTKVLAVILKVIPKFGALRAFDFKVPSPKAEDLYFASINATADRYRNTLKTLETDRAYVSDRNLDTGDATKRGEYSLADKTYERLLKDLKKNHFQTTPRDLEANLVRFFDGPPSTSEGNKDKKEIAAALTELKSSATSR